MDKYNTAGVAPNGATAIMGGLIDDGSSVQKQAQIIAAQSTAQPIMEIQQTA